MIQAGQTTAGRPGEPGLPPGRPWVPHVCPATFLAPAFSSLTGSRRREPTSASRQACTPAPCPQLPPRERCVVRTSNVQEAGQKGKRGAACTQQREAKHFNFLVFLGRHNLVILPKCLSLCSEPGLTENSAPKDGREPPPSEVPISALPPHLGYPRNEPTQHTSLSRMFLTHTYTHSHRHTWKERDPKSTKACGGKMDILPPT